MSGCVVCSYVDGFWIGWFVDEKWMDGCMDGWMDGWMDK